MDYAIKLAHLEGINSSLAYFDQVITISPKRIKEKKLNEVACYHASKVLIEVNDFERARRYFFMGKKSLTPSSKYNDRYKELAIEFSQDRSCGKLYYIVSGKGYGFLELNDNVGIQIFLHRSEVIPKVAIDEFENMKGSAFSFIVEKNEKGLTAKHARLLK